MKQAILITAYKDIELLKTLVNSFNDNFNIYIHIDKKTSYLTHDINLIKAKFNVKVIDSIYKINWGGFNHLRAILHLAKKALLDNENHFFLWKNCHWSHDHFSMIKINFHCIDE